MKSWIYPGAKVVCIAADGLEKNTIEVGQIYTIRDNSFSFLGEECVKLVESDRQLPYRVRRFRPLVRDETMDKLRNILTLPVDKKLLEDEQLAGLNDVQEAMKDLLKEIEKGEPTVTPDGR